MVDKITAPISKVVSAPFKRSEAKKSTKAKTKVKKTDTKVKKTESGPKPEVATPKPAAPSKSRPTPAVAREQLMVKFQDMYWLQKKWDAAAMNKRVTRMTDEQVYEALDLTENDIDTAVRRDPRDHPEWASPDDPTSNILWYHGGQVTGV